MGPHVSDILRSPLLYTGFQYLVGGARMRTVALRELALRDGERVLDLGCGPAYYRAKLPAVDYWGFDTDRRYIRWARRYWGGRGRFFDSVFDERQLCRVPKFDAVMLMGLLHHISDAEGESLLSLVGRALAPKGRIALLDTVVYSGQSAISRLFARNDRGEYVRTPEEYSRLGARHFEEVSGRIVGGFPFPTECYLMTLRRPRS